MSYRCMVAVLGCVLVVAGCGDAMPNTNDAGTTTCVEGVGTWDHDSNAATACVPRTACAAGTFVAAEGNATTNRTCAGCASGTYSTSSNAAACTAWTSCVAGEYVSAVGSATSDQACTVCAQGTYTSGPNQSTCVDIGSCAPGTIQTAAGTDTAPPTCMACSAGEYCAGGTAPAAACNAGDGTWDHDSDPATTCVARTTCVAGTAVSGEGNATADRTCAACTTGTFSDATNASSCTPWQMCAANFTEGTPGSDTMDRECATTAVWTAQFGTASQDIAYATSIGSDGSVVVAGETSGALGGQTSAGGRDAFVRKYDAMGTLLWTRQFGSTATDVAYSVAVGADGSIVVAGASDGVLPGQASAGAFVRKLAGDGSHIWTRQFGAATDIAFGVAVGTDGSVVVGGRTLGTLAGGTSDAFVLKYNLSGTLVWTRQFGTAGADEVSSVSIQEPGGAVVMAGHTSIALAGQSVAGPFVSRYDSSGTFEWARQFGPLTTDRATSVVVDSDGNVAVAGTTAGALAGQTNAGMLDVFVQFYDTTGTLVWAQQFGTVGIDRGTGVAIDGVGGVLVAGVVDRALPGQTYVGGFSDGFARRYDSTGALTWTRQFGSITEDVASSIGVSGSGNVVVSGYTDGQLPGETSAGSFDAFVMELRTPN